MNPNGFNPDQNPFEAIFAQGQGQPAAAPATPTVQPAPAANGQVMPEQPVGPDELQPGKTGDNTKPLLSAIQNLHGYIAASADPGTIQLVRNLISALTQLVARDQKASAQLAQQQVQQNGQAPNGQMPAGQIPAMQ